MQYKLSNTGLFLSEFLPQAVQAGQYRPVSECFATSSSTSREVKACF